MKGIYKCDSKTSVGVSKFHEITNTDDPALVENLVGDTFQHYSKKLISAPAALPTNTPSMSRASQLLGIGAMLGGEDDDDGDVAPPAKIARVARPAIAADTASSSTPSLSAASAQPPQTDDMLDDMGSLLEDIRPKAAPPASAAAAKPRPKAKAKGQGKSKATPKAKSAPAAGPVSMDMAMGEVDVKEEMPPPSGPLSKKRRAASPIESMDPNLSGNMAASMAKSDNEFKEEAGASWKKILCFAPRDPDNEFKADAGEVLGRIGNLLAKIRKERRSVNRRKEENKRVIVQYCDDLEENCTFLSDFFEGNPEG